MEKLGVIFMDIEFQFYKMERAIGINSGDGSTTLCMYLIPVTF